MVSVQNEARRVMPLWLVQGLEAAVVLAVGLPVLLTERIPQGVVLVALAFLLVPLLLRVVTSGAMTTPSLVNVPILLLLFLLLGTYWVTPSLQHTWPELVRIVWGIAVFFMVVNWMSASQRILVERASSQDNSTPRFSMRFPPQFAVATGLFLGMGLLFTTVGILGMAHTRKIDLLGAFAARLPSIDFPGINQFNTNDVAGIIVLFMPLALALTLGPLQLRQHSLAKWLLVKSSVGLFSLVFSVALLVTQTRGAWLAAGCALVVVLGLLGRRGWTLLVLAVLLFAATVFSIGPAKLLDELTVYATGNGHATTDGGAASIFQRDRNLAARVILWQRAAHAIADAPMTGIGLGAFAVVSQLPYPEVEGFIPDPDMSHVHNIVLQMGVDFGVPGIIAFVALSAIIAWLLVRLIRQSAKPSLNHTWSLGLLGSYVAYLVYNMLNITALGAPPAVAVWFLFGLCVGAGEWARGELSITKAGPLMPTPDFSPPPIETPSEISSETPNEAREKWSEWERQAWAATTRSTKNKGPEA